MSANTFVFAVLWALLAACSADPWTASAEPAGPSYNNDNRRFLGGMGLTGMGVGAFPGVGIGGFGMNPYGGMSGQGGLGGIGGYGMGGLGGMGGPGMPASLSGMGGLGGIGVHGAIGGLGGMGGMYPGMMTGGLMGNPWLRRHRLSMPFMREEE